MVGNEAVPQRQETQGLVVSIRPAGAHGDVIDVNARVPEWNYVLLRKRCWVAEPGARGCLARLLHQRCQRRVKAEWIQHVQRGGALDQIDGASRVAVVRFGEKVKTAQIDHRRRRNGGSGLQHVSAVQFHCDSDGMKPRRITWVGDGL